MNETSICSRNRNFSIRHLALSAQHPSSSGVQHSTPSIQRPASSLHGIQLLSSSSWLPAPSPASASQPLTKLCPSAGIGGHGGEGFEKSQYWHEAGASSQEAFPKPEPGVARFSIITIWPQICLHSKGLSKPGVGLVFPNHNSV